MKVRGIPLVYLLLALFLGLVVGLGVSTPLLRGLAALPAAHPFERPYPFPHKFWGQRDEFYVFASGGQQGGIYVYTLPSMKFLSEIPIFAPDQAWGWRPEDPKVRQMLTNPWTGQLVTSGDTHHPVLSKTGGVYDGRWLFINDKLHPRVARVDLDTFRTGQVLWVPNITGGIHGFHTSPETDLLVANVETEQYPAKPIVEALRARGVSLDYEKGPYAGGFAGIAVAKDGTMRNAWQVWGPWGHDMMRIGWGQAEGWVINTTYNSERAVDVVGMFKRDQDYLFFWRRASIEEAVARGKTIATPVAPDVPVVMWRDVEVYAARVPLNPHGLDISPTGRYILVGGKATSLVTAVDMQGVLRAIREKRFVGEEFGVPILDPAVVNAAVIDAGLGPTHVDFDDKGFAYVGFFVDSDIKRIPLGEPYTKLHGQKPWRVAEVIPVHYSVGHLLVPGGDTAKPYGKYLVSMNKLAKDTFSPHGPLITENHELFSITSNPARRIDQMPLPPETHYSQAIPVALVRPKAVYPRPAKVEDPKVEYDYGRKEVRVNMHVVRSFFNPSAFNVPEGWKVRIRLTSLEEVMDITHGFALVGHDVSLSIDPGEVREVEFTAGKPGVYWYYCIWFCSELHLEMRGRMVVVPAGEWSPAKEWRP